MNLTPEENQALVLGAGGTPVTPQSIWICNPHGVVLPLPLSFYERKNAKGKIVGRKYDYGYRLATAEEIQAQSDDSAVAQKKAKEKDVVVTKIIQDEPVEKAETPKLTYQEMKKMASAKGIKSFGVTKDQLMQKLGLS